MTPPRAKRRAVFDPNALDEDLDELLPKAAGQPAQFAPSLVPSPTELTVERKTLTESTHAQPGQSVRDAEPTPGQQPRAQSRPAAVNAGAGREAGPQRRDGTVSAAGETQTRYRPPEVLLSAEVYDALYQLQIAEKKSRRGLARPMGAIVLDAIEKHAQRLVSTWEAAEDTVGEGGLFVRPSSSAVPRRRRHAVAPRTVVLSGVNALNSRRLDALVEEWGAGTRSALVEQALRYEFALI